MQIKRTVLSLLLCFSLLLCAAAPAFAAEPEETIERGKLGATVKYELDRETGVLQISLAGGAKSGRMNDFTDTPLAYPEDVGTIVIEPWMLNIGSSVFAGCKNLNAITIPKTVRSIGADAFKDCGDFTVRYGGTQEEWDAIEIDKTNDWVKTAFFVYGPPEEVPENPYTELEIEPKPETLCRWCNTIHGDSFFQRIVAWFHGILAKLFRK